MKKKILTTIITIVIVLTGVITWRIGAQTTANEIDEVEESSWEMKDSTAELFESKTTYIGDNSADANVLSLIQKRYGTLGKYTLELQTDEEPYTLILHFEKEPSTLQLQITASIFMVLVENCNLVQWDYPDSSNANKKKSDELTLEQAAKKLQMDEIKIAAQSEKSFENFLYTVDDTWLDEKSTKENKITYAAFSYEETDELKKALYKSMVNGDINSVAPENEINIPAPIIYGRVTENGETLIFANLWSFNYIVKSPYLFNVSGGEMPACVHFKENKDGGYDFVSLEQAGDGENYAKDIESFCAGYKDIAKQMLDDSGSSKYLAVLEKNISAYVKQNKLNVKFHKVFGWDIQTLDK